MTGGTALPRQDLRRGSACHVICQGPGPCHVTHSAAPLCMAQQRGFAMPGQ